MSNPKKIYLSPEIRRGKEHDREFATNRVESDWVEYVRADLIKSNIDLLKRIIESDGDVQTMEFWSGIHAAIDELQKLIEK